VVCPREGGVHIMFLLRSDKGLRSGQEEKNRSRVVGVGKQWKASVCGVGGVGWVDAGLREQRRA